MIINFLLNNIVLTELISFILITIISSFIFFKIKKLYNISDYEGFKFLYLAFFCFSLGYFFVSFYTITKLHNTFLLNEITFPLFVSFLSCLTIGNLYLAYSLVWKKINNKNNLYMIAFLGLLLTIISLNISEYMYFAIQFLVLGYAIFISNKNYQLKKENNFSQLYFIALILILLGFIMNFLTIFFSSNLFILFKTFIVLIVFLIFLYGVLKL